MYLSYHTGLLALAMVDEDNNNDKDDYYYWKGTNILSLTGILVGWTCRMFITFSTIWNAMMMEREKVKEARRGGKDYKHF